MTSVRDNDTPAQSQPQARRAADRDPAGGETPVERPSQPPSKSFALASGEVVSNAGVNIRLYRKVLISEAPGINSPSRIARESSGANRGRRLRNFPSGGAFAARRKRSGKGNF